eukprot:GHVL01043665.1.p2 GENE.GHVL01043665.1~~GHVL01043665.1.p2  ORF type:complete len:130 (+),score=35.15 GHVL01043665.1:481-870(+)
MARCRYDLLLNPLGPNVKLISYDNGLILLYKMQQTPQERKPSRLAGGFNSQMFNRHSIGGPLAVCDASHKGGVMIPQGSLPQGSHNNSLGGGNNVPPVGICHLIDQLGQDTYSDILEKRLKCTESDMTS